MPSETIHLSDFIREHLEPILQAWEDFARTLEPSGKAMDSKALRDHASQMLKDIATDLDTPQSASEQSEKSKGKKPSEKSETAAKAHAMVRLQSGFSVTQVAAEFRAMRTSVLQLWAAESKNGINTDPEDITRFNEAIDQSLVESIDRYANLVEKSQNMFLAVLGHDLRNPLGATITGATVLMNAPDIDSKYVVVATRIFNSGQRMSKLVNDLIDFTRTHLGSGLPIFPQKTNIGMICQRVVDEMRTYHAERIIEFDAAGKLDGTWDEGRIAQAISNLLGNSHQHGSKTDPIILKVAANVDEVIVTINNQGQPIPQEKLPGIFDPLVRFAENETKNYSQETSMGMGLYIAREVAIAHGGNISVESTQTDGTTFTLRLPNRPA